MPGWFTILISSVVSILYLFFLTRLIGKRQISQLTLIDFVIAISIGSIAAETATNIEGPMINGILAMTIYAAFPLVTEWLAIKSKVMRNLFEGNSTILIKDGKILEDNLKQERISSEDLLELLRGKNVFKAADVEFAVMEPSGQLSVLLKADNQPLTPKQMGMTVAPAEEPQAVIMDGVIMDEPLATLGLNRGWIQAELEKAGVALENVFLGQVDRGGQLYLDLFDDKIMVAQPTALQLTFATLKKCQADLELYALATRDQQMKKKYGYEAKRLKHVIQKVEPLMMR